MSGLLDVERRVAPLGHAANRGAELALLAATNLPVGGIGTVTTVGRVGIRLAPQLIKHHVIPRAFAKQAAQVGINVHDHTVRVPGAVHNYLRSGGPRGGWWNAEWRALFTRSSGYEADGVWALAAQLIDRASLYGYRAGSYWR